MYLNVSSVGLATISRSSCSVSSGAVTSLRTLVSQIVDSASQSKSSLGVKERLKVVGLGETFVAVERRRGEAEDPGPLLAVWDPAVEVAQDAGEGAVQRRGEHVL